MDGEGAHHHHDHDAAGQRQHSVWTDVPGLLEDVRRRWLAGDSAGQIAIAVGCGLTPNAIIGRMHRDGLKQEARAVAPRALAAKTPATAKRRPGRFTAGSNAAAPVIVAPLPPVPSRPPPHDGDPFTCDAPPPGAVALTELERHHCRWPLEVPDADTGTIHTLHCGARRLADGPYCGAHALRAFGRGQGYRVLGWS